MSGWGFTKAHVPNYVKGLDTRRTFAGSGYRFILAPRSPAADILGAAYHLGEIPSGPDFQGWLSEFIPDPVLRAKLGFDLKCLNALNPSQSVMDPLGYDLSAQDSLTTTLGTYLLGLRDFGLRGRVFDFDHHLCPLFTSPSPDLIRHAGQSTFEYWAPPPTYAFHSFFRAIEINPALPEANRYTEATHIAARFNCQNLLKALANSPADYLKQDNSNFLGVLDGLTALHHAALAFSPKVMEFLLKDCGIDFTTAVDKKGNTLLHALACSKGPAEKQLGMLQDLVKLLFDLEFDAEKRERFYQHKNTAGDTALNVAANAKNKELVQKLMFLPGADTEEKSDAHPKGVDFTGLGIHYGKLLSHEYALLFEKNLAFGERLDRQEEVVTNVVAALRATVAALEDAKEEIALLKQNQLLLMQMVGALAAGNPEAQRLIAGVGGRLAAPFLALGDAAAAGAGFDADEGVEEAKGLDHE